MNNRIKYARYLNGWVFECGDKDLLRATAEKVPIGDYESRMKGQIFCPECSAGLYRSPEGKEFSSNGRPAYFGHRRGTETKCGLRTKPTEGKRYLTEEDAWRAIQNEELVIVSGFIKEKPIAPDNQPSDYDATAVEDIDGPVTDVPIGRHHGDVFKLPSQFKTIRGICNKFDENLGRYFYLPNGQHAVQLQDLLKDIQTVTDTDENPRLYYGTIIKSSNAGRTPQNIRMTKLKYSNSKFPDFFLKLADEEQQEKGINDESAGRIVLMYGKVTKSGRGLCMEALGWGEFALLPRQYAELL